MVYKDTFGVITWDLQVRNIYFFKTSLMPARDSCKTFSEASNLNLEMLLKAGMLAVW